MLIPQLKKGRQRRRAIAAWKPFWPILIVNGSARSAKGGLRGTGKPTGRENNVKVCPLWTFRPYPPMQNHLRKNGDFWVVAILPLPGRKSLEIGLGRSKGRHFWKELRRPEDLEGNSRNGGGAYGSCLGN